MKFGSQEAWKEKGENKDCKLGGMSLILQMIFSRSLSRLGISNNDTDPKWDP